MFTHSTSSHLECFYWIPELSTNRVFTLKFVHQNYLRRCKFIFVCSYIYKQEKIQICIANKILGVGSGMSTLMTRFSQI